ncbi:MAG: PAS domain S-box protein [Opitutaceae bacterium]
MALPFKRILNRARQRKADQDYASILRTAIDGFWLFDTNGRIFEVNESYCRMSGYSRDELLGMRILDLEADCTSGELKEQFGMVMAMGSDRLERRHRRKDGTIFDVDFNVHFVDRNGGYFMAFLQDITARRRSETILEKANEYLEKSMRDRNSQLEFANTQLAAANAKLEAANAQLHLKAAALASAANAIVITNKDGIIEFVNPGFSALTGYCPEEAIGHNPGELIGTGKHSAAFFQQMWETILAGSVWQGEMQNRRKDGTPYSEYMTITPVRVEGGPISHFVAFKEDITRRKEAEARIREQADVIEQAPVAIVITDLAGRVTYCNAGALRMHGLKTEELIGRTAEEIFSPEALDLVGPGRSATLETGAWRGEVSFQTRDGRHIVADCHMSLILDDAGHPKARLSIAVDITDQKHFEEQALRAQRVENLGMLAAGIAHDLNNALSPIVMAGPMLRDVVGDAAGLRMLDIVEKSAAHGATLVRQMLSFARGTAGQRQLLPVKHVAREVVDLARSTFPKTIRVESHVPSDLWPILADPTQIHQVFLNLCINARDAMGKGGDLTLTAANRALDAAEAAKIPGARQGNFVAIEVRDTGTGIVPDVLDRIWEPFFTTKGLGKGTGLGLSTVLGIVRQHEGFLTVETSTGEQAGSGTAFTVYLPAAQGAAADEGAAVGTLPPRGHGEMILLVDDEESVREVGTRALRKFGYRVVTANDGAEAISVFVTHAADVRLLLTDMQMPAVGGSALALALRCLKPDLPVVVMSGADEEPDERMKKLAATYLSKPFEAQTLLSTVRRALDLAGAK